MPARAARAETLLTPHPAEAARLLASNTAAVQSRPRQGGAHAGREPECARGAERRGSILVARDGHWFVNRTGNPGMASAGMGDVLAGMLGALLAQGYSGESALVLGTHLHGAAADALGASGVGPVGMTATEVADSRAPAMEPVADRATACYFCKQRVERSVVRLPVRSCTSTHRSSRFDEAKYLRRVEIATAKSGAACIARMRLLDDEPAVPVNASSASVTGAPFSASLTACASSARLSWVGLSMIGRHLRLRQPGSTGR